MFVIVAGKLGILLENKTCFSVRKDCSLFEIGGIVIDPYIEQPSFEY